MRSDWSPEELISSWTLEEADWRLLANKTSATRLGFAVLLRFFELEGRFPADADEVPAAVVDYLAGQVKVDRAELDSYWTGRAVKYHRAPRPARPNGRPGSMNRREPVARGCRVFVGGTARLGGLS